MADGFSANDSTGTPQTIDTEALGSGEVQRVKLAIGVRDTDNGDVSATNPMPVADSVTEASVAQLITTLQSLIDYLADTQSYQNALPYARDISGQMYVNVASGVITTLEAIGWGNSGATTVDPAYYGAGSPNSMDLRDMHRVNNNMGNNIDRNMRWVFS